jgi:hypothetical protein
MPRSEQLQAADLAAVFADGVDIDSEIVDTIVFAPRLVQLQTAGSARPADSATALAKGVDIEAEYETPNENQFPTPIATPDPTLGMTIHETQTDSQDNPIPVQREIGLDVDEGNILTGRRIRKTPILERASYFLRGWSRLVSDQNQEKTQDQVSE